MTDVVHVSGVLDLEGVSSSIVVERQLVLDVALFSLVLLLLVLECHFVEFVLHIESKVFGLKFQHVFLPLLLEFVQVVLLVLLPKQIGLPLDVNLFDDAERVVLHLFINQNVLLLQTCDRTSVLTRYLLLLVFVLQISFVVCQSNRGKLFFRLFRSKLSGLLHVLKRHKLHQVL